jgi:hypothetical protein
MSRAKFPHSLGNDPTDQPLTLQDQARLLYGELSGALQSATQAAKVVLRLAKRVFDYLMAVPELPPPPREGMQHPFARDYENLCQALVRIATILHQRGVQRTGCPLVYFPSKLRPLNFLMSVADPALTRGTDRRSATEIAYMEAVDLRFEIRRILLQGRPLTVEVEEVTREDYCRLHACFRHQSFPSSNRVHEIEAAID